MWKRFVYFVWGIYRQQRNPLTIFTRAYFCMKHWVSIHCFDVFKPFVAIHSASPTPAARPHQTLKQTTKVIIQADYKTPQQATGHHHKNDRVHIGNCHPAPVEHQHQSPSPAAALCAQLPSVHTIHPWLHLQTMRDSHHNTSPLKSATSEPSRAPLTDNIISLADFYTDTTTYCCLKTKPRYR